MANPVMVAKLKKVQAIAKKLKKERPRLTHIEAIKLAWKQIPKTKKSIGAVKSKPKKSTTKITTKKVTSSIGSKKNGKDLIVWIYDVILRDPDTDKILFKKRVKVKRVNQRSAKEYMIKKFPRPYFFELWNTE
jgi:hypothetical protein